MLYSKIISKKLDENLETMKFIFHSDRNSDIVFQEFKSLSGRHYFVGFIDGMADGKTLNDFIIRPLTNWQGHDLEPENVMEINSISITDQMDEAVTAILNGDTAVFVEGFETCFLCETKGFATRSVSTPATENTIKGSQEAFNESIRTNTTLIHRIIRSPHLCSEFVTIGDVNKSLCTIMYLDNIVNKKILDEVRKRLHSIKGDYIMGSGMLEQLLEDNPFSLFPSLLSTERPERAAHYISTGRIIVIADGTPFAIVMPVTLSLLLDSPEGNSQRWQNGTFSRLIRIFALFCSTMLSACYLALILFHRELIPTTLLGAIVESRANIPFPSVFEVLVMELFFELVREAGLRIPHMLGNAIGVVGGLILGQAAVDANLVSPVTLIVVALSGLGNSALPDFDLAFGLRTIKVFLILLGANFGFLGLAVGIALILTVLSNQNSFGVPMLSVQSMRWSAGSPLAYQLPLWKQESRPRELKSQRPKQQPNVSRPWFFDQREED